MLHQQKSRLDWIVTVHSLHEMGNSDLKLDDGPDDTDPDPGVGDRDQTMIERPTKAVS
ncbi:hypothetical protein PM082_017237 [Marasmius tenuissimus]|nr:hypothetical protein PM082_017237 [Marasmius tenuissimus]